MEPIYLPENIVTEEEGENVATFSIFPYFPGYGPTVGNALRRVLLSSLPGAAITYVKISGVDHEFTALPGIKEDMVTLMLNLKKIRLSSTSEKTAEIKLQVNEEKKVVAGDFNLPPEVSISNPQLPIVTITDNKTKLEIVCLVEQGRGYIPSETREHNQHDIGMIALDSTFTPVQRVSFRVENVRVGQATDYHKLVITIATDGTITPKDALHQAASILADHFQELTGDFAEKLTAARPEEAFEPTPLAEEKAPENTLNLLQLPSRVHNALERVGITAVEQVIDLTEEQIQDIPGLGEKAVQDILSSKQRYLDSKKTSPEETKETNEA